MADDSDYVYGFAIYASTLVWRVSVYQQYGWQPQAGPMAASADGRLVFLSVLDGNNPAVLALSSDTGATQWMWAMTANCGPPVADGNAQVLVCCDDGLVYALNQTSGNLTWTSASATTTSATAVSLWTTGAGGELTTVYQ